VLIIDRAEGRSVYIGKDITVTVLGVRDDVAEFMVTAPATAAVSASTAGMAAHVEAQLGLERMGGGPVVPRRMTLRTGMALLIGRGVTVLLSAIERDGDARIGIEAPRHMAVSRDDFTFEEHMEFQRKRDAGVRA